MVFFFILDVITSTSLYIILKCGKWIVFTSANGVYYLCKKISGTQIVEPPPPTTVGGDDGPNITDYVIISREEYLRLTT